jgi:tRNA dimethylallyltransferase
MYADGLVEEAERLDLRFEQARTASRAIGYRDAAAHLRGEISRDEAIARTQAATRRFARRQDGWFRKDPRVVWVRFDDPGRVDTALKEVAALDRLPASTQGGPL